MGASDFPAAAAAQVRPLGFGSSRRTEAERARRDPGGDPPARPLSLAGDPEKAPETDATAPLRGSPREGDEETLRRRLREANAHPPILEGRKLRFGVIKETNRFFVQVIEPQTGDVIRTLPPEEFLRMALYRERTAGELLDSVG